MKKILVVEDELSYLKLLKDQLTEKGYEVIEAKNGKEGVEKAIGEHPDLILLDIRMPVMSGIEVLKRIRKDFWGSKVPVIILTNFSATDEELVQDVVTERPLFYLIKSDWKIYDVLKKIKAVLKEST